ncbi:hypothetical protein [Nostoc sp. C117]|uniref:hypothetical protein n=1 Tax=Nostoc sp. C117 TaxID=3349875 RepID=UPI00370DCEA2
MEIIAIISSIMGLSALGTALKFVRNMKMFDTKKKREVNNRKSKTSLSQKDDKCFNCPDNPSKGSVLTLLVLEGNLANLANLDSEGNTVYLKVIGRR